MTSRETYERRIKELEDLTGIQCLPGNCNYNEYMRGMANGMLLALHVLRGQDGDPKYKETPRRYLES